MLTKAILVMKIVDIKIIRFYKNGVLKSIQPESSFNVERDYLTTQKFMKNLKLI